MNPTQFLPPWIDGKYQQPLFSFEGKAAIAPYKGDIDFQVTPMPRPDLVELGWSWGLLQHLFTCEEDTQRFASIANRLGTHRAQHFRYEFPMVLPGENPAEVLTQPRRLSRSAGSAVLGIPSMAMSRKGICHVGGVVDTPGIA